MIREAVGVALAEWDEQTPLRWALQEPSLVKGQPPETAEFDFTCLNGTYGSQFLIAVKEALISARHRKKLISIINDYACLRNVFIRVANSTTEPLPFHNIGPTFIRAMKAAEDLPPSYAIALKSFYRQTGSNERIFDVALTAGDFPRFDSKRGVQGDREHSILAVALRRSALVHILNVAEQAFEEKRLTLGRYAFIRLALNVFCRPISYRRLTVASLRLDTPKDGSAINYFLDVPPGKTRINKPEPITYHLHSEVGKLLALHVQELVAHFGHLAPIGPKGPEHSKLALFPSTALTPQGQWQSEYASQRSGMLPKGSFSAAYLKDVRNLASVPLTFVALRHTIGTQLAQAGCSSHTIQAVLKHASPQTAQAYVDIVFEGLIDALSDALEPAFQQHFPVFKDFIASTDPIPVERRIVSEDLETERTDTTGMCGRRVACAYAPISCYDCPRYIPCYDVDHTINLDVVTREITAAEGLGTAMIHEVSKWKTIRNQIRVVISACEIKRAAVNSTDTSKEREQK